MEESEEEEDISYIDEKPKTINKKNNKADKVIKNKSKNKNKKEEKNRNLIKVYNNNIVDIDKSLLKDLLYFNQNLLPSICRNQNNLIINKKTSVKYNEFHNKIFKYNEDDLEQYKFSTYQIDDELFTVTLNRFPSSNDIVIKIKKEK